MFEKECYIKGRIQKMQVFLYVIFGTVFIILIYERIPDEKVSQTACE